MTTAIDIKNAAQSAEESPIFRGCFILRPSVMLIHIEGAKAVTATLADIDGKHPNTVHIKEMGHWYPAGEFEIVG